MQGGSRLHIPAHFQPFAPKLPPPLLTFSERHQPSREPRAASSECRRGAFTRSVRSGGLEHGLLRRSSGHLLTVARSGGDS